MRIAAVLSILLAATSLFSPRAECAEWKHLTSSQGNEHYYAVIEEPLNLTDMVVVREKTVYCGRAVDHIKYMHGYQYRDFTESVRVFVFDCVKKRHQLKAVFHYNSGGEVIDSINYKDTAPWSIIRQGTIPDQLYRKACGSGNEKQSKDTSAPGGGKDK